MATVQKNSSVSRWAGPTADVIDAARLATGTIKTWTSVDPECEVEMALPDATHRNHDLAILERRLDSRDLPSVRSLRVRIGGDVGPLCLIHLRSGSASSNTAPAVTMEVTGPNEEEVDALLLALNRIFTRGAQNRIMAEFSKAATTRDDLIADAQAINLEVKVDKRGRFLGIEEQLPGHTDTIRMLLGDEGAMAYRDLSGVAHGGVSSLLHRMEQVAAVPGRSLMKPTEDVRSHLGRLAFTLIAFTRANEARIRLFGWDATKWIAWRRASRDTMRQLFD